MLNHKGTKTISTDRLTLGKIRAEDYMDMYRYTQKEEVARYVTWDVHKNPETTKALCSMWAKQYKNDDRYNWAIVCNDTVIGNIEVVKLEGETAYMGWQLDSDYWNKGIMTEAAAAVRDYLFSEIGIEAMEASHMQANIGSGRVMQKIGMTEIPIKETLEYKLNHRTEFNGMPIVCYKITREEWVKL